MYAKTRDKGAQRQESGMQMTSRNHLEAQKAGLSPVRDRRTIAVVDSLVPSEPSGYSAVFVCQISFDQLSWYDRVKQIFTALALL